MKGKRQSRQGEKRGGSPCVAGCVSVATAAAAATATATAATVLYRLDDLGATSGWNGRRGAAWRYAGLTICKRKRQNRKEQEQRR